MKKIFLALTFLSTGTAYQVNAADSSMNLCQSALAQCKASWKQAGEEKNKKFKIVYPCQKDCLEAQKACHHARKEARNKGDKQRQTNADENLMSASAHSLDCQQMYKLSSPQASETK